MKTETFNVCKYFNKENHPPPPKTLSFVISMHFHMYACVCENTYVCGRGCLHLMWRKYALNDMKIGLFNLGIATSLRKGKLWIFKSVKLRLKFDHVSSCSCRGIGVCIYTPYRSIGQAVSVRREIGVQSLIESYQRLKKKRYLMLPCLTLNIYKVLIKGQVEQSKERSSALTLHLSVVAIEKGANFFFFFFLNILLVFFLQEWLHYRSWRILLALLFSHNWVKTDKQYYTYLRALSDRLLTLKGNGITDTSSNPDCGCLCFTWN